MVIVMPEYMPASHHLLFIWFHHVVLVDWFLVPGFGNQFNFGYEVEVELSIQLENGNEVEYE